MNSSSDLKSFLPSTRKTGTTETPVVCAHVSPNDVKALRNKSQLRIDTACVTGVNPARTHGLGLWGNPRVVMSVRVDKGLKKQFISASQALFGSTCNPVECFMASIVGVYQNQKLLGVYPSSTSVNIGEITIHRNLQERRKLTRTDVHTVIEDAGPTVAKCGFVGCENDAVAKGLWLLKKREYLLCKLHLREVKGKPKDWKVLTE